MVKDFIYGIHSLLRRLRSRRNHKAIFASNSGKERKIFQIGFNKAATRSLHLFFVGCRYNAVHWDAGMLAERIFNNKKKGRPLLFGYEEFDAFSDMECMVPDNGARYVADELFEDLYKEYPNALFILNVRPLKKWLKSRLRHAGGFYANWIMRDLSLTKDELINKWTEDYNSHILRVTTFFRDKPNFLFFDISKHGDRELKDFFSKNGVQTYYAKWSKNFDTDTKFFKEHLFSADQGKIEEFSKNAKALESTYPEAAINLLEVVCSLDPEDKDAAKRLQKLKIERN